MQRITTIEKSAKMSAKITKTDATTKGNKVVKKDIKK